MVQIKNRNMSEHDKLIEELMTKDLSKKEFEKQLDKIVKNG